MVVIGRPETYWWRVLAFVDGRWGAPLWRPRACAQATSNPQLGDGAAAAGELIERGQDIHMIALLTGVSSSPDLEIWRVVSSDSRVILGDSGGRIWVECNTQGVYNNAFALKQNFIDVYTIKIQLTFRFAAWAGGRRIACAY